MAGTRAQTTLIETRIGTDNKAPGTPQTQVQKINETKMTTGLRVKRRPSSSGVITFASKKWRSRYQAGGRSPFHKGSKVRRPTVASTMPPATGLSHDDFRRAHHDDRRFYIDFRMTLVMVTFVPAKMRVSSAVGNKASSGCEAGDHEIGRASCRERV